MPKTLFIGGGYSSGVDITWTKTTQNIYIGGWYDGCVGIEGKSFSLKEFFDELGITEKACRKAFATKKEE